MGYGEFRKRLQEDPDGQFARWFGNLLHDVTTIIDRSLDCNLKKEDDACSTSAWVDASVRRIEQISQSGRDLLDAMATPAEIEQMPWLRNLLSDREDDTEKVLAARP